MIPPAKGILTVKQIPNLQRHSPLKILGLAQILGNLKGGLIDSNRLFIEIIQVLHLKI